jgi:hypothetical protein
MRSIAWRLLGLLMISAWIARADQIEMQNGDRYSGVVVSMTPDTVMLKSEILGQIKLPRGKISTIALGPASKPGHPVAPTNNPLAPAAASSAFSQLGANTNVIKQIRDKFLADAGPEANGKFDELLTGLMTGKLDMNDLRAQAKTAADQVRSMKKDAGPEASETLDVYLQVLDGFLAESEPAATPPTTNSTQGTIIIR